MIKVKVLIDCVGVGYDLKTEQVVELNETLAKELIAFNYVEKVTTKSRTKEKVEK